MTELVGINNRNEHGTIGNLPIKETIDVFQMIPDEKWKLPEPMGDMRIKTTDSLRQKNKKRIIFADRCDEIFSKWVNYCRLCQKGYRLEMELEEKGKITQSYQNLTNLKTFRSVMFPKIDNENDLGKLIHSCYKGFASLLSKQTRKDVGIRQIHRVNDKDIENTRFLIKGFEKRLIIKH